MNFGETLVLAFIVVMLFIGAFIGATILYKFALVPSANIILGV